MNDAMNKTSIIDNPFTQCFSLTTMVTLNYSLGITIILFGCIAIIADCTICAVILTNRKFYRLQYALVFMLCSSDLLISGVALPLEVASYLTYDHKLYIFTPIETVFQNAIWYALTSLSILSLTLISIEKFITIYYPFKYIQLITKKTVSGAIIVVWLQGIATFVGFWYLQRWPDYGYYDFYVPQWFEKGILLCNFVIPSIINFVSYGYIFKMVIQHSRKNACGNFERHKCKHRQRTEAKTKRDWRQDLKIARNLKNTRPFTYIVISFCFLWLPFILYQVYLTFDNEFYYTCHGELIDSTLSMITFGSCVGNALIYGAFNAQFRKLLKKVILCTKTASFPSSTAISLDEGRRIRNIIKETKDF